MSTTKKARAASIALGASALVMGTSAVFSTPVVSAASAASSDQAASTAIEPSNLTVTPSQFIPSGSTITPSMGFPVTMAWDVPKTAVAGTSTTIKLSDVVKGDVLNNVEAKDSDGDVIAYVSGNNNVYTVDYTDYAKTHDDVKISVTIAAIANSDNWGELQSKDVSVDVGSTSKVVATYTLEQDTTYGYPYHLYMTGKTPNTHDMVIDKPSGLSSRSDNGKVHTQTFTVADASVGDEYNTIPYAHFDIAAAKAATYKYELYDASSGDPNTAKLIGTYTIGAADADNPAKVSLGDVTSTSLTVNYTPPADQDHDYFIRPILADVATGDGPLVLTDEAISSAHEGPYVLSSDTTTVGDSGDTVQQGVYGIYAFDKASGSGTKVVEVPPSSTSTSFTSPVSTDSSSMSPSSSSTSDASTSSSTSSDSSTASPSSSSSSSSSSSTVSLTPASSTSTSVSTSSSSTASTTGVPTTPGGSLTTTPATGPKVQTDNVESHGSSDLAIELGGMTIVLGGAAAMLARKKFGSE